MKLPKYTLAAAEAVLIFPAALFMLALFMRNVQPVEYEPAHMAQQIVGWYAARPQIGLWGLLIALPFTVLVTGCATVWRRWERDVEVRQAAKQVVATVRAHATTVIVAGATAMAAGILGIVALHVVTD